MMAQQRVIFDAGPRAGGTEFAAPLRVIRADSPAEVPGALAAMEAARAEGLWLAGYASYELGYCLAADRLGPLMPAGRATPLVLFGAFEGPRPAQPPGATGARLSTPEPEMDFSRYRELFARAHDYIGAGDIYQVNLTFPMRAHTDAAPAELYAALAARQPVGHGALVELGGPAVLSRSPELFFSVSGGKITTRPMKGTVARGATPAEDARLRAWLAASEKDRAENLMIVDLLRNDISRVAEAGSVMVPELFHVESYETVHQMVSEVEGRLVPGTGLAEIFAALFPCGSVTGAPKVRAMEIIAELEETPRDVYCGAIGWAAPDGRASFNVAIRTLVMQENGELRLNVGGGVVWDSTDEAEYREALWKARFATLD